MYRNSLERQSLSQERGVSKACARSYDQVVQELNDYRLLAGEYCIICSFAGGKSAAEEDDLLILLGVRSDQKICECDSLVESLDVKSLRECTYRYDYIIVCLEQGIDILYLGVESDVDIPLLELSLIPLHELLVSILEGHCGSCVVQTEDLVALLEYYRVVASLLEYQSCLESSEACAYDGNFLRLVGRNDLVLVVLHS